MSIFTQELASKLKQRKSQGLYRQRKILSSPQDSEIIVNDKRCLSFCSNDYLGLANHPEVIQSFKNALDRFGAGSGASHLITGHSQLHHDLEVELAAFTGRSRALLFSSGYMANVGVITTLLEKNDHVFEDKLNHASLIEGGLFSGASFKRYRHLDYKHLQGQLQKSSNDGRKLIVSDGVFSMDGDTADLAQLIALSGKYNAQLMIDDAHGFGCLGSSGGGLVQMAQEQGVDINEENLPILIGTFGKAFGTSGAFVAGSEELIESLIQYCRPYIYTTAMAPAVAAATLCSLNLLKKETWRRAHLKQMIESFRDRCDELSLPLTESSSPVQAIVLGDVDSAVNASQVLEKQGIMVSAIRPPTVAPGTSRLRFTFSASHTQQQMKFLLKSLELLTPFITVKNKWL